MISRLLCFLSFHDFIVKENVISQYDVAICNRCNRRWAVNTATQRVFEIWGQR